MAGQGTDGEDKKRKSTAGDVQPLWRVQDVAQYLGLTVKGAYGMAERGGLPSSKVGGRLRFDPEEVRDWVRRQRRGR